MPSLRIGPDDPDAVHIGTDLADKVMSGGVQVWPEPVIEDLPVVGRWLTETNNNSPLIGGMSPSGAGADWRTHRDDMDAVRFPSGYFAVGGSVQYGAGTPVYTIATYGFGNNRHRFTFTEITPNDLLAQIGTGVEVQMGYQAP